MARPKKYASAAERQAAWRAKRNVTPADVVQADNVTNDNVTTDATPVPYGQPAVLYDVRAERRLRDGAPAKAMASDGFVSFRDQPHVPHDGPLWIGAGRGTSREYKGEHYVLVSRSVREAGEDDRHGVVTDADWNARLPRTCWHGLKGWACHVC